MHLLDVETLRLKKWVQEKNGKAVDEYATLSHRWLAREDEILFQDIELGDLTLLAQKGGFYKLKQCCEQARCDKLKYVWIDTCCIDRSNSTELQEAINSMYRYYANARKCYVYLKDTTRTADGSFKPGEKEDYFERGWTLQELIAPPEVYFFDKGWHHIGDKRSLRDELSRVTGIDPQMLDRTWTLNHFSVAQRMSWASGRKTTKDEDLAYSLIGLFDVNMPMLYGEGGRKAFLRLQEEIIKKSDDHSIFAWKGLQWPCGLLATNPDAFRECGEIRKVESRSGNSPFSMTNRGLSITLVLQPWAMNTYMALLNCIDAHGLGLVLGIFLWKQFADDQYSRICVSGMDFYRWPRREHREVTSKAVPIFVRQDVRSFGHSSFNGFQIRNRLTKSSSIHGCWDPKEQTVAFGPGTDEWRDVATLNLSNCGNIRMAKLGFDFDFSPTILLCESTVDPTIQFFNASPNTPETPESMSVWRTSTGVSLEWNRIIPYRQGCNRALANPYHGLWVLKGDRIDGLVIDLADTDLTITIRKKKEMCGYSWNLRIFHNKEGEAVIDNHVNWTDKYLPGLFGHLPDFNMGSPPDWGCEI